MKASRIAERLERASEVVFSEEWQAKFFARVFGVLGVACLVGALWNAGLLIFVAACIVMAIAGAVDNKDNKDNDK